MKQLFMSPETAFFLEETRPVRVVMAENASIPDSAYESVLLLGFPDGIVVGSDGVIESVGYAR